MPIPDVTPDDLTLDDLAAFHTLGPDRYCALVLGLFLSGRATPALWQVMARAILHVSESSNGHLVRPIDQAILRQVEAARTAQEAQEPTPAATWQQVKAWLREVDNALPGKR